MGTEAPSPRFNVHTGAPVFTHTQGRRFPSNCETCSGKPIKVFLCTKCLLLQACYPSFARRWNGTPCTVCCKYAHGTALWRTSFRKHCPSRSRLLRQERIGKGLCCKPKKSPSRSSVLDADKSFLPLGRNVFGTVPFLWRRTRALHRSGTGTLYPEHGSGIKELSHGNTSYLQRS